MPLRPQRLHYAAIIATCQVNEASLTLDMLQLSRSNVNSVVRSYLSPTPVGVGVGTSLIWAVDQTLLPARVWLRETMYAFPYCKRRKAGRGLGIRLLLGVAN